MNAQKLGPFLVTLRKEVGMTQAELADKLHVSDKTISKWERSVGLPDISNLEPLAEALGVSLAELMQAKRNEATTFSESDVDELLSDTIHMADTNRRLSQAQFTLILLLVGIVALFPVWLTIGSLMEGHLLHLTGLVGTITFGLAACMLPLICLICGNRTRKYAPFFVLTSMGFCLAALTCLFFDINAWVAREEWVSMMDVVPSIPPAVILLSSITIGLNLMVLLTGKYKNG